MAEPRDIRLKRLAMRSGRRGIKEMDLILADFAARALGGMSESELDLYEALLEESDHDLFAWVNGQTAAPPAYAQLIDRIADGAKGLTRPNGT